MEKENICSSHPSTGLGAIKPAASLLPTMPERPTSVPEVLRKTDIQVMADTGGGS